MGGGGQGGGLTFEEEVGEGKEEGAAVRVEEIVGMQTAYQRRVIGWLEEKAGDYRLFGGPVLGWFGS